jgi:hypothetical protein
MSPTIHPGTIVAAGTYPQLVANRRQYGDRTYGDRHLQRQDMAANMVKEAADCLVYVLLERERWDRRRPDLHEFTGDLHALDRGARRLGSLCEHAARHLAGGDQPAFDAVFRDRWQFGLRNYGDQHLERDNLAEILEEVADIQILGLLELDRREKTHRLAAADRTLLAVVDAEAARFAGDVVSLRDRVLAAPSSLAA